MNTNKSDSAQVSGEASTPALTPWFPASVKPARVGTYEVRYERPRGGYYSHFDGDHWRGGWATIERAAENVGCFDRSTTFVQWRGLANKPARSA